MKATDISRSLEPVKETDSSFVRIIGIGECGCRIVDNIRHTGMPNTDFVLIGDDGRTLLYQGTAEERIIDCSKGGNDGKIQELIGDYTGMLFVVADVGDKCCSSIVSALCRQFRSKSGGNNISIVIASNPSSSENGGEGFDEGMAAIAKVATKVITLPTYTSCASVELTMCPASCTVDRQVYDAIYAITQTFMRHDYMCVDYNDVKALLQFEGRAISFTVSGSGESRSERAVMKLMECIDAASSREEEMGTMLFHLRFASPSYQISAKEYETILNLIPERVRNGFVIFGASDDCQLSGDELLLTAIVTLVKP